MLSEACKLLEQKIRSEIPVAGQMGLRVAGYESGTLTIEAALEPNINVHGTAFGGSLYSIAALTGWGLIYLRLQEVGINPNIVIVGGDVKYQLPVTEKIVARSTLSDVDFSRFLQTYKRKGIARMTQSVNIVTGQGVAMTLAGRYVQASKESHK